MPSPEVCRASAFQTKHGNHGELTCSMGMAQELTWISALFFGRGGVVVDCCCCCCCCFFFSPATFGAPGTTNTTSGHSEGHLRLGIQGSRPRAWGFEIVCVLLSSFGSRILELKIADFPMGATKSTETLASDPRGFLVTTYTLYCQPYTISDILYTMYHLVKTELPAMLDETRQPAAARVRGVKLQQGLRASQKPQRPEERPKFMVREEGVQQRGLKNNPRWILQICRPP